MIFGAAIARFLEVQYRHIIASFFAYEDGQRRAKRWKEDACVVLEGRPQFPKRLSLP